MMDNFEADSLLDAKFTTIAGNDGFIQLGELQDTFLSQEFSNEERAAALRIINAFEFVDVAKDSDLERPCPSTANPHSRSTQKMATSAARTSICSQESSSAG